MAKKNQWKFVPHSFSSKSFIAKLVSRPICTGCGLMRLRNELTEWCVRHGCNYDEHPAYKQVLRALPKMEKGYGTPH